VQYENEGIEAKGIEAKGIEATNKLPKYSPFPVQSRFGIGSVIVPGSLRQVVLFRFSLLAAFLLIAPRGSFPRKKRTTALYNIV